MPLWLLLGVPLEVCQDKDHSEASHGTDNSLYQQVGTLSGESAEGNVPWSLTCRDGCISIVSFCIGMQGNGSDR
jgi:hypothetical protein